MHFAKATPFATSARTTAAAGPPPPPTSRSMSALSSAAATKRSSMSHALHVPPMLWQLALLFVVVAAAASVQAGPVARMERPQRNDVSSVADAIRYLQELDQYYGQISRPRFGKRSRPFYMAPNYVDPEDGGRVHVDPFEAENDWKTKLFNERR